jgi:hypothetical protein
MSLWSLPVFSNIICKDIIEICILTYCFYKWLAWLKQDTQKPLLYYFYGYCGFLLVCSALRLETLMHVLQHSMPLIITLFVLVHQHTLQKNFVSLYKIKPAQKAPLSWLQHLIRFCLQTHTDLSFLIEHTTTFAELLHTEIALHTPLETPLLHLIAQSVGFNPTHYIYIDTQGTLLGINTTWKRPLALTALDEQPLEKASYYLIDSDGCMLHYTHKTRTFSVIIRQKIYANLNAAQVLQSLSHYFNATDTVQGKNNENHHSTSSYQPFA